ncbi:hypothetical protein [Spiroplasma cantharicola]|uniref:PD-(D/E)XK endonuclease-like domain-containing protein n=1 Tax=Spiroplasma cantharicola TaxID=362837 RepID=A0A0M5KEP6_9MOLU|nr:hypothetical protein [Spiroplasma cantharicola]ALD66876.1 hypothetical protein SCANT_v1c09700 [Spiroplasma cantharicola]
MIYDLTDIVLRDENYNYVIKNDIEVPINLKNFIVEDNKINLPFVSVILEHNYPYLHNKFVKKEIVENSIKQGICVHNMISQSIKERNDFKLNLNILDCKNTNHINIAKRIITELNSFIYKYNIDQIYSERTYLYLGYDCNYLGTIDIILKSKDTYYIMDIKTSRSNFVDKYNAQLFLYKKIFENASKKIVENCFILNPREDRVFMEYVPISKKEQTRIISSIKNIKIM